MAPARDIAETLEIMKAQLELILKRIDSAESKISVIMKREEENSRMLTSVMETMAQMGLVAQPYRKSEQKGGKGEDRAYW